MKVLLITQTLKAQSGLGRYSKGVRDALIGQGVQVSVMCEEGEVFLSAERSIFQFLRNCFAARRAARNTSIVHALDVWPYGVYALCAVLGTRKSLFLGGVGTYSMPPQVFSLKRFLMLRAYRRASAVFCISHYTKKRILRRLPFMAKLAVVHLAADPLPVSFENARKHFSIPENASPILISVGEVKERKGQLDTLHGIAPLVKRYRSLRYLIVGSLADREYVAQIEQEAVRLGLADHVQFIDSATSDFELAALYSLSDVLFLNSNNHGDHFEGFGLVFLEANQFGVPGIGSRGCGIEDAIRENVSGLLVPQKDHAAIAEATEKILSQKERFAQGARDWYTRFGWRKTIDSYLRFYTSQ